MPLFPPVGSSVLTLPASIGPNGSWTTGNGTGTELKELWLGVNNPGGNVLGVRNNATSNALATFKGTDANGKENFALGQGTSFAGTGPAGTSKFVFLESSDIDNGVNVAAPPIFILMTGNYGSGSGAQYIRQAFNADGSVNINDKIGQNIITVSADGLTLTFGGSGTLSTVSSVANVVMGTGKLVTLAGGSLATSPAIELSASGPNLFNAGGGNMSLTTGTGAGRAVAISIDNAQIITFLGSTVFSQGPTVPSITVQSAGTTYLIWKDTNVGSGKEWEATMQDDGGWHLDFYNGSARIHPLIVDTAGKVNLPLGKLNLTGIPTSSSGLSSGDVYSNAGILTIVP